jgi:hypothetical protein
MEIASGDHFTGALLKSKLGTQSKRFINCHDGSKFAGNFGNVQSLRGKYYQSQFSARIQSKTSAKKSQCSNQQQVRTGGTKLETLTLWLDLQVS